MILAPKDPDYEARVRASFDRQAIMHTLGITLADISPGHVELDLPFNASFTQQHGFLHAGTIATALDSACGYAAFSLMAPEDAVLTVEFKTNLLAPATGSSFRVTGQVVKPGRNLTFAEAKAHAVAEDGERLVATMTATIMAIRNRDDVRG